MRIVRIALLILICVFAFQIAFPERGSAHSDGEHLASAIEEQEAVTSALKYIKQLVEKGKIEKSWEEVQDGRGKIKQFGRRHEWVVTFNNPQAKDPSKRTLYFFLTLTGDYIAANFTGK